LDRLFEIVDCFIRTEFAGKGRLLDSMRLWSRPASLSPWRAYGDVADAADVAGGEGERGTDNSPKLSPTELWKSM
jgi:hypothetical protein